MNILENQPCPLCQSSTLTLMEREQEVPFFGMVRIFSMTCTTCKFHKADVETRDTFEPVKYTFEIESEEDLKIRVIKSSQATLKIPRIFSMTPGAASQGFVTNIEGVLARAKYAIRSAEELSEDPETKKKSKALLKKLNKAQCGQEKLKIIIEDPTGNSAIISDRAIKSKLWNVLHNLNSNW